jgi:hypothetical protein
MSIVLKSFSKNLSILLILSLFLNCSKDDGPKLPEQAELFVPINGENCQYGKVINSNQKEVEFSWSDAKHVTSYNLFIKNIITSQTVNRNSLVINSSSVYLKPGFPYEWNVTSISEDYPEESAQSQTWRFYLPSDDQTNSPPFPASLISPSSGETISLSNNSFTLDWDGSDPDGDVLRYDLFVDKTDGFQPTLDELKNLSNTSKFVILEENSEYFWRVISEDSNGNKSSSQVYTFRTN